MNHDCLVPVLIIPDFDEIFSPHPVHEKPMHNIDLINVQINDNPMRCRCVIGAGEARRYMFSAGNCNDVLAG